jgi:hypothetical protein
MGLFRHQAATSSMSVGSSSPLSVLLTRLDIGHCEGDSRQLALDALGPPHGKSASPGRIRWLDTSSGKRRPFLCSLMTKFC